MVDQTSCRARYARIRLSPNCSPSLDAPWRTQEQEIISANAKVIVKRNCPLGHFPKSESAGFPHDPNLIGDALQKHEFIWKPQLLKDLCLFFKVPALLPYPNINLGEHLVVLPRHEPICWVSSASHYEKLIIEFAFFYYYDNWLLMRIPPRMLLRHHHGRLHNKGIYSSSNEMTHLSPNFTSSNSSSRRGGRKLLVKKPSECCRQFRRNGRNNNGWRNKLALIIIGAR